MQSLENKMELQTTTETSDSDWQEEDKVNFNLKYENSICNRVFISVTDCI